MKFRANTLLVILLPAFFLWSCRKEPQFIADPEKEVFNFKVTEAQKEYINSSRGDQYLITDPLPELLYAGEIYSVDRFEIRGDNTLDFERKGFGVNMGRKIHLFVPGEQAERKFEEFKLLAMVYDYTYIENSIAVGMFRKVGLWPVYSFFTEVRLNDETQGLYHFIEDPFEYFIEQKNSPYIIRRGYDHVVKASSEGFPGRYAPDEYPDRFDRIYSSLPDYSGRQMFDTLSAYMDLKQYFTKLSIDMLIRNGDYTDEVIFYAKPAGTKEIFGVFPWDYDDLFSEQPHEIGNWWATGSVFGDREYNSTDDVIADVGMKLLYSIEDDLDYKIAKDEYLYQEYLKTLRSVMNRLNYPAIDSIFDYTYDHISPFYNNAAIVAQSEYDDTPANRALFVANLAAKRQLVKDRWTWIKQQLDIQQQR